MANIRIAAATLSTVWSETVTMTGSSSFNVTPTLGTFGTVPMVGAGAMSVGLSQTYLRLAGATLTALGTPATIVMSGHGQMGVSTAGVSFIRVGDARLYQVEQILSWNGSQWVAPSTVQPVTMTGAGTMLVGAVVAQLVSMVGAGVMRVAPGFFDIEAVTMIGAGTLALSDMAPVFSEAVVMAGAGDLLITLPAVPPPPTLFLFTPPTMEIRGRVNGTYGLTYGWLRSSTVWKDQAGVWHTQFSPRSEDLSAAQVWYNSGPVLVDEETANELIAAGIGTVEGDLFFEDMSMSSNNDGTVTIASSHAVDNGDGTFTLTTSKATFNGDGTYTLAV